MMSERVEPEEGDGQLHTIPEALKGYAFFIKNQKDAGGAVPDRARDRAHNKFTRVVSLKKLIQVSVFDSMEMLLCLQVDAV